MKNKIKIALVGFGKMGKEVDALCRESEIFEVEQECEDSYTQKFKIQKN